MLLARICLAMTRSYYPINSDLPTVLPAIRAAGYQDGQFGTIAWEEISVPPDPNRRFIQLARVSNGKSMAEKYDFSGHDWVQLAVADLKAGVFGKP
jgi:hypothetical protein